MGDAVIVPGQSRTPRQSVPDGSVLTLRGVGMEYTDSNGQPLWVLDHLDLSISAGELVCLAGRSGSGKTTAVMIAAGLLTPTAGGVNWGELELGNLGSDEVTRERGRRIGLVFQNAALIATLRAAENVALAGMTMNRGHHGEAERIETLLGAVGLVDRARHFPAQLSGGEQQRVALARALYRDPPLLLVDEPTANLDRTTANAVIALLTGLRDEGKALLVASHDEALVSIADQVIEME